jgi:hypothetical protein
MEPNMALGIRQHGSDAVFATLYAVDAPSSSIERGRDGTLAVRIAGGVRPELRLAISLRGDGIVLQVLD